MDHYYTLLLAITCHYSPLLLVHGAYIQLNHRIIFRNLVFVDQMCFRYRRMRKIQLTGSLNKKYKKKTSTECQLHINHHYQRNINLKNKFQNDITRY